MYHNICSQQLYLNQIGITSSKLMSLVTQSCCAACQKQRQICQETHHLLFILSGNKPISYKLWVAAPSFSDASIRTLSTFTYEVNSMCVGYGALVAESSILVKQN